MHAEGRADREAAGPPGAAGQRTRRGRAAGGDGAGTDGSERKSSTIMVYVTDEQIAKYKRDGYLIIPSFLNAEESAAALEGFYDNVRTAYRSTHST